MNLDQLLLIGESQTLEFKASFDIGVADTYADNYPAPN